MTIEWDATTGRWVVRDGDAVIGSSRGVEVLTRKFPTAKVVHSGVYSEASLPPTEE